MDDGLLSAQAQAVVADVLQLAALVGVLGALLRWALRRFTVSPADVERAVSAVLDQRLERIEARQQAVEMMARELLPNGGSSLADRMARIEAAVIELRARSSSSPGEQNFHTPHWRPDKEES